MATPAVVMRGISKRYIVGGERDYYPTLRDRIASTAGAPFRRLRRSDAAQAGGREFWALRDVSLAIPDGETVGFIGRNGAGKTTLLKILARITDPTEGFAEVKGRVGSLLEVGTGFHPELTGRENIFLNGAILGMTREETRRKMDAIVAFAGVDEFLDTPVKRYSSGMYVRLAFSVAAHLEPDILIVDEVLAVGDAEFQKKCVSKMREVAGEGHTVLFVSHNLAIVQALCTRAVHLSNGSFVADGPVPEVVAGYLRSLEEHASVDLLERTDRSRRGYRHVRLARATVTGGDGGAPATGHPLRVELEVTTVKPRTSCSVVICDHFGLPIATLDSGVHAESDTVDPALGTTFVCEIDELPLLPGRYRVDVVVHGEGHLQDGLEGAAWFDVQDGTYADRTTLSNSDGGRVAIAHRWRTPKA